MIIDSHHHLWAYSVEEYGWIGDGMSKIARDFTVADLQAVAEPLGVIGSVAVQARQVVQETDALLWAADANDFIKGVVGWLPPEPDAAKKALERTLLHPKLKGFRYVVQDEVDNEFILGKGFNESVAQVFRLGESLPHGLVYDILIFERQLGPSIEFVDRHPNGRFVLDHIAKPKIKAKEIEPWKANLFELAKRENVTCKISGIVTEDDWATWSLDTIRPYLDAAIEAFGPSRLMYGSDWPVALLATEYQRWLETVQAWAGRLSADEQKAFYAGNVIKTYNLDVA